MRRSDSTLRVAFYARVSSERQAEAQTIASQVASQLNLNPVITGLTDTIGTEVQLNESDLAFLRRLLTRYDADMQVVGRDLQVSPRKDVSRGNVELSFTGQLRRARVIADLAHQVTAVTVSGWDYKQGQKVNTSSTGTNLQPGDGRAGASILHDTLGERSEHIGDAAIADQAEAQALDSLADVLHRWGRYGEALELFGRAGQIYRRLGSQVPRPCLP